MGKSRRPSFWMVQWRRTVGFGTVGRTRRTVIWTEPMLTMRAAGLKRSIAYVWVGWGHHAKNSKLSPSKEA